MLTDCTGVFDVVDLNFRMTEGCSKVGAGLLHAVQLGLIGPGALHARESGAGRFLLRGYFGVRRSG